MLTLISPAKTLDFETPSVSKTHSKADFLKQSAELIEQLQELSPQDISSLMSVSDKIGELNYQRFMDWATPLKPGKAKQAVLAFKGDVYTGLDAESLSDEDFSFAQDHLRILSGLYGLLRPLDLILPYRLEMGTKFANRGGKNLYEFWGEQITEAVNAQLASSGSNTLVNLASNEYYKAVKPKLLNAEVITPQFKDLKNGQYKMISFYAKKARGLMAAYMIRERIVDDVEALKGFDSEGYYYSPEQSDAKTLVFLRDEAPTK